MFNKRKPCHLFGLLRYFTQETLDLSSTVMWYGILVICIILLLNMVSALFLYLKRTRIDPPVVLSPQQKRMLGIKNDGNLKFLTILYTQVSK